MTVIEKVAYLKGLAEGLNLNSEKAETKMFNAIIDVLEDIAETTTDLDDTLDIVSEQLDEVDEDCCCGDDYDECDCGCCGDETEYYEVECPACHETICVDEGILEEGATICPNCGEKLEFEIEFEDEKTPADEEA